MSVAAGLVVVDEGSSESSSSSSGSFGSSRPPRMSSSSNSSGSSSSSTTTTPQSRRSKTSSVARIPKVKAGALKRKTTWSAWTSFHYVMREGLILEFKNSKSVKPRKVVHLAEFGVKLAATLTGHPNTFALFSLNIARDPIYFRAPDEVQLISWVTALQQYCSSSAMEWEKNVFLEALNDPVLTATTDGTIIGANSAFLTMYEYENGQLYGQNVKMLMEDKFSRQHDGYLQHYRETGEARFIGTVRRYRVRNGVGAWVPSEISLGLLPKSEASASANTDSVIARFRHLEKMPQPAPLSDEDVDDDEEFADSGGSMFDSSRPVKRLIETHIAHVIGPNMTTVTEEVIEKTKADLTKAIEHVLEGSLAPRLREKDLALLTLNKENSRLRRKLRKYRREQHKRPAAVAASSSAGQSTPTHSTLESASEPGVMSLVKRKQLDVDISDVEMGAVLADGGGSGATICLAYIDGWQCICKEIRLHSSQDTTLFEFEILMLESLPVHRNLVKYLFHIKSTNRLQIFLTRYDGTLRHVIKDVAEAGRPLSALQITKFAMDITRGVEVLHLRDIIHRDLKPENIFVIYSRDSSVSRLAVGDFDSAKRLTETTVAKTMIGTLGYIAPEVLMQDRYGPSCDIYSIGCIIFELVYGIKPFHDLTLASVFAAANSGLKLNFDRSTLPSNILPLIDIAESCTNLHPTNRPTATQLIQSLAHYFCTL